MDKAGAEVEDHKADSRRNDAPAGAGVAAMRIPAR